MREQLRTFQFRYVVEIPSKDQGVVVTWAQLDSLGRSFGPLPDGSFPRRKRFSDHTRLLLTNLLVCSGRYRAPGETSGSYSADPETASSASAASHNHKTARFGNGRRFQRWALRNPAGTTHSPSQSFQDNLNVCFAGARNCGSTPALLTESFCPDQTPTLDPLASGQVRQINSCASATFPPSCLPSASRSALLMVLQRPSPPQYTCCGVDLDVENQSSKRMRVLPTTLPFHFKSKFPQKKGKL